MGRRRTSLGGGNRGRLRRSRRRPQGYGDWNLAALVRGADALEDLDHGVAQRIDSRVDIADDLALTSAETPFSAAWHNGCPYRGWPITIQQAVRARYGAAAHVAPRRCGGARIGCPRAKVSMMIIGAPQSGQT